MLTFLVIFIFSLLFYLFLTIGSGNIFLWSREEIILGLLFSVITALALKQLLGIKLSLKFLNPGRGFLFFIYVIGPFLLALTRSNFDVVRRVITGKIRPGIVKISPGLNSTFGATMMANSITLTPGTLTVDIDEENNLYVHCLYLKKREPRIEDFCSKNFWWLKKITE